MELPDLHVGVDAWLKLLDAPEYQCPLVRPPDKYGQIGWYLGRRVFVNEDDAPRTKRPIPTPP